MDMLDRISLFCMISHDIAWYCMMMRKMRMCAALVFNQRTPFIGLYCLYHQWPSVLTAVTVRKVERGGK